MGSAAFLFSLQLLVLSLPLGDASMAEGWGGPPRTQSKAVAVDAKGRERTEEVSLTANGAVHRPSMMRRQGAVLDDVDDEREEPEGAALDEEEHEGHEEEQHGHEEEHEGHDDGEEPAGAALDENGDEEEPGQDGDSPEMLKTMFQALDTNQDDIVSVPELQFSMDKLTDFEKEVRKLIPAGSDGLTYEEFTKAAAKQEPKAKSFAEKSHHSERTHEAEQPEARQQARRDSEAKVLRSFDDKTAMKRQKDDEPGPNDLAMMKAMFDSLDMNQDGKVSHADLKASFQKTAQFEKDLRDGMPAKDGVGRGLNLEEFLKAAKKAQENDPGDAEGDDEHPDEDGNVEHSDDKGDDEHSDDNGDDKGDAPASFLQEEQEEQEEDEEESTPRHHVGHRHAQDRHVAQHRHVSHHMSANEDADHHGHHRKSASLLERDATVNKTGWVTCGAHQAPTCHACPSTDAAGLTVPDMGGSWCNGDCVWGSQTTAGTTVENCHSKTVAGVTAVGGFATTAPPIADLLNPSMTAADNNIVNEAASAAIREENIEAAQKQKAEENQAEDKKFSWGKFWLIVIITFSVILGICAIVSVVALVVFCFMGTKGPPGKDMEDEGAAFADGEGDGAEEKEETDGAAAAASS